ncbi:MAG: alpha/beta hydrolase [Candidatus Pelagibacter sp.]|nr:alpha/beta hydrolase [Candidatus Pelagibacter sp.]OUW24684.1 MAG: alpha/beta hydrolase [Rickettsiales bacterium TMED174]|tara:strand:+ start:783 stop:1439 length:657 start_codon:yes stop_codon:yes gene_type:complete
MKQKSSEIFIPGPAGRLEAKYYKNPKFGSPVAIVLHPHPQYGGTMNNKIVQLMYNIFLEKNFSVIKINFRGVGKSEGVFDNGQGELSDAAAALDWIERENLDYSQCWVSGFSFGALICMQLIMRRPEVNNFIAVAPQPNVYDFSFLAPCPTSGQVVYSENDELVTKESIIELDKRIKSQKGVEVLFESVKSANHFFKNKEGDLNNVVSKYIEQKTALI